MRKASSTVAPACCHHPTEGLDAPTLQIDGEHTRLQDDTTFIKNYTFPSIPDWSSSLISSVCLGTSKRFCHPGWFWEHLSLAICVRTAWNSLTDSHSTMPCGSQLYTCTMPNTDLRYKDHLQLHSLLLQLICLLCRCAADSPTGNNMRRASWHLPKVILCRKPRIPIFRLRAGGGKLKSRNATCSVSCNASTKDFCIASMLPKFEAAL